MAATSAKGGLLLLLLLLGGTGGVGYWNYQRNVAKENSEPRPFRGYATPDLDKLIAAQKAEIDRMRPAVQRAEVSRAQARGDGFLGDQVREFERVHRHSEHTRELSGQLSDLEIMQQQLEKERALRVGEGQGALLNVLKLAFTF
jgi:hypothetical protein